MLEGSTAINYSGIVFSCFLLKDYLFENRLDTSSLVYNYSGVIDIEYDKRKVSVPEKSFVFLQRTHKVKILKHAAENHPYKAISIRFERKFLRKYLSLLDAKKFPKGIKPFNEAAIILKPTAELKSIFSALLPYTESTSIPRERVINNLRNEAIETLLLTDNRFYPSLFDFSSPYKIDLLSFMENNFSEDLSIKEFANYTARSLSTFKRDFAKISETTPERWLMEKRLEKAYDLLAKKEYPPSKVYLEVGFKNRTHFAKAFKDRFGKTPSAVMNQLK